MLRFFCWITRSGLICNQMLKFGCKYIQKLKIENEKRNFFNQNTKLSYYENLKVTFLNLLFQS
jgi:hypothetical protein